MAGNKKKKKPAANPARGFATTSIASKPKPEESEIVAEPSDSPDQDQTTQSKDDSRSRPPGNQSSEKELHELTPEQLEEQLENSDLQLLVEKHGPKVRKDSSRHASRFQTDWRTLRPQSQQLDSLDWLPADLLEELIDFVKSETSDHVLNIPTSSPATKSLVEEDTIVKTWTLQQILLELGFSEDRVTWALKKLLSLRTELDTTSPIWGFTEALDILALECETHELSSYGDPSLYRKKHGDVSVDSSRPETPVDTGYLSAGQNPAKPINNGADSRAASVTTSQAASAIDQDSDEPISDEELEPEDLIPKYISLKERLYYLDPNLVLPTNTKTSRRGKQKGTGLNQSSQISSKSALSLQRRLQKIESDVLFDQREADYQWGEKRLLLSKETTTRRQLDLLEQRKPDKSDSLNVPPESVSEDVLGEATAIGNGLLAQQEDEDGDILGGIFGSEIDESITTSKPTASSGDTMITIRNFGKATGMSPRRVFEEACRARDPGAKVYFQHVSPTTYSSRHSVTVMWSKNQESFPSTKIPSISSQFSFRSFSFTMTGIATPDTQQSEAFVATAALFLIFSNSAKEEKAYLRLPAVWRDLWFEFVDLKKEQVDAEDREAVKDLRAMIRHQRELEEEEGVVLTRNFKKRDEVKNAVVSDSNLANPAKSLADPQHFRQLWAKKTSTPAFSKMLRLRKALPMYQFREAALESVSHHQVTILCGETGCGKSTQLPSFILEHELSQGRSCKIYCTEPRRISAISLAQRVSEELGEPKKDLGTNRSLVGYAIRLESNTSASTRLVYATVGIVLRMLESSRGLDDITHLILDEVHERSIDTDFLLIILRDLMERRPELKVVLMSATVDAQRFSQYLGNAPIITVPGRTFPVNIRYLEDAVELTQHQMDADGNQPDADADDEIDDDSSTDKRSDMVKIIKGYSASTRNYLLNFDEHRIDYELIVKLIKNVSSNPDFVDFSKAILVFLPGMGEIRQLNDMLLDDPDFGKGWLVYPLHSTIASEDQQQAFVVPPQGMRKIVLATNIAETGITIPDVTCVIDTGKHREMRFDERRQLSRLIQSFISKANAKQRRGRAGRVQEGLCFHLFTRYRHDNLMAEQQTPEMLRLSLQDLVMRVKICKLGEIEETLSQALDPPSAKNIRRAIDALVEVDALSSSEDLTPLGRQIAKLPLDASLGKLVLLGSIFNVLDVTLTIAAILSSKSPFNTPIGAKQRADAARLAFKRGDSDLLTAYNAYASWRRVCAGATGGGISEFAYCKKNFLNAQNLANIEELKAQLLASLVDASFVTISPSERASLRSFRAAPGRHRNFVPIPTSANGGNENDSLASAVIAWSFYPKVLAREGRGWRSITNSTSISLHSSSVNKGNTSLTAKLLSYYHIMQTASGARFLTAHATTPAAALPLMLLAGEAEFKLHAGVILLDGSRLRLAVRDWKTMVVLKALRLRLREVVQALLRAPEKPLSKRLERWMALIMKMFEGAGLEKR